MKKLNRFVMALTILVLGFVSVFNVYEPIALSAKGSDQIVTSLEIIDKSSVYYPEQDIFIKGSWSLPDDNEHHEYRAGDSFSISIPEGLIPNFTEIPMGKMGLGRVVDGEIVFTFNDNIEGLIDREGGFNIAFKIDRPSEEAVIELPLEFVDERNELILKDFITVDNSEKEIHTGDKGVFSKTSYMDQGDFRWYIYVNRNGSLIGDSVHLNDRLDHNQKIDRSSLEVFKYPKTEEGQAEGDGVRIYPEIFYHEGDRGFDLDLDISDNSWYYIEYKIIYIGGYDNPDADENGMLDLKNTVALTSKEQGYIPLDHGDGSNVAVGKFNIGGWAQGFEQYGSFSIKKIDATTGKAIENVTFRLTNKKYPSIVLNVSTNETGVAYIDSILGGLYVLEEIVTPDGYLPLEPMEVLVDIRNGKNELVIENIQEPISIQGEKFWKDAEGNPLTPDKNIVIQLYANGRLVRQKVLRPDERRFEFNDLERQDQYGEDINYVISERKLEGFTATIEKTGDYQYRLINQAEKQEEFVDITVEKDWYSNNKKVNPVKDITLELLADGKVIEVRELSTEDQKESIVFSDLPKMNQDHLIDYQIKEVLDDDYDVSIEAVDDYSWKIRNDLKPVSIRGKKLWYNKHGQEIKAASSIDIYLYADGEKVGHQRLDKNTYDFVFVNYPKYNQDGEEIVYQLQEDGHEDFYPSILFNETNKTWEIANSGKGVSLQVEKKWFDGFNNAISAPFAVDIDLYANDQKIKTVTLDKHQSQYTFDNLAKYDYSGEEIEYRVEEADVLGFKSSVTYDSVNKVWLIENYQELTSVEIKKTWVNRQGELIDPVKDIEIILLANGEELKRQTLSKEESDFIFEDLPLVDENGTEIVYSIEEVVCPDFYQSIVFDEENNLWQITNSGKGFSIEVEKTWYNTKNEVITSKQDVRIDLLADGKEIDSQILKAGKSKIVFEDLAKYNYKGEEINYQVVEEAMQGYRQESSQDNNKWTLENYELPISIKGKKAWFDHFGNPISALCDIKIQLEADGIIVEEMTLDTNTYDFIFVNLPRFNENGERIKYQIKEEDHPVYRSSVVYNPAKDLWELSNNIRSTDFEIHKKWLNAQNESIPIYKDVVFKLYANDLYVDSFTLAAGESVLRLDQLAYYDYDGKRINYRIEEEALEGFSSTIHFDEANNRWNVNNQEDTMSLNGRKIWLNHLGEEIAAATSIQINLLANQTVIESQTLLEDQYEFYFDELPIYDYDGQKIRYEIQEVTPKGFVSHIDYDEDNHFVTVTNNMKTTQVQLEKTWFNHKQEVSNYRQKIKIILYADDIAIQDVWLDQDASTHIFENLPKYNAQGEEIVYRVEEEALDGFESSVYYDAELKVWKIENHELAVSVKGEKRWYDHEGSETVSQEDIELELYADGNKLETLTLLKGETTFEFENLARFNEAQEVINYEVKEVSNDYNQVISVDENGLWQIENTLKKPLESSRSIRVTKRWINHKGQVLSPQADIKVSLYANNERLETRVLTKDSSQTLVFEDLDSYDHQGKLIDYQIVEEDLEGYRYKLLSEKDHVFIINQKVLSASKKPPQTDATSSYSIYIITMIFSFLVLISLKRAKIQ